MSQENTDVVNEVASALEDFASQKISADEMDLRIHDKRYHPHGFKDGNACKYRKGSSINQGDTDKAKKHYTCFSRNVTLSDMCIWLKDKVDVKIVFAEDQQSLEESGLCGLDALNLTGWGNHAPKDMHEKNVRVFFEVCRDIKNRFSKFTLLNPFLLSWIMHDIEHNRAISTLDKRVNGRSNYIALGDYYTGDRASLNKYHIVRHEIGHSLATQEIADKWSRVKFALGGVEAYKKEIIKSISSFAPGDEEEDIAEAFAVYTEPYYQKGAMPKWAEEIIETMLGEQEKIQGVTMDEKSLVFEQRPGLEAIDADYLIRHDSFLQGNHNSLDWYDAREGLIHFSSYQAKAKHILSVYKVPEDWINAIMSQFPDKKWNPLEIDAIKDIYRNTTISKDSAIEYLTGFFKK